MKENIKNIRSRPQLLLSLFGFIALSIAMLLMTYFYSQKSRAILYSHVFDQLSSINTIKTHNLQLFFQDREADVTALASNQTIIDLSRLLDAHELQSITDKNTTIPDPYREYLSNFLKQYMYTDILIMDAQDGDILSSLNYKQYIGKNLYSKAFENSEMTKLWKKVIETNVTHISDMHIPVLYTDVPVMLVGAPVFDKGKLISIVMIKMPSTSVNTLVHVKSGDLKTYETYAIGQDHLFRSDSFLEKRYSVKNSFLDPNHSKVYTKSIDEALSGKSGSAIVQDYRNLSVLSVYSAFKFDTLHWAVVSEIDDSEIASQFDSILRGIYIWTIFVSFLLIFSGYFVIKSIIRRCVIKPLEKLYTKAKGFEDIINDSLNEIYIFDKTTLYFIFANKCAQTNAGYTLEELQYMKPLDLKPYLSDEEFQDLLKPLLDGSKQTQIFETLHRRKDGTDYNVFIHLQLIDVEGVECFVAFINDTTEYKQVLKDKQHFNFLASHDHLTKIYNRQMFDTFFEKEIQRGERYDTNISLILFDIDDFKMINDSFGHKQGDEVLIKITTCVTQLLRESDIFARWGGEEFVILMLNTNIDQAVKKADEIRASIQMLEFEFGKNITCSFGVAQIKKLSHSDTIFIEADQALYKAKENGKNRVEKFNA
ncbi:MAG: sensor domain-containing diguanylate cyclase [Thiovulaceae bacterium]|nr:sensor domain-containing diguanylate cyclase [Sulfurimonadaceae bacterium]